MFDAEITQSQDVDDESYPCNKSDEQPLDITPLATKSARSGSIEIESEEEEGDEELNENDSLNEIE